MICVTAVGHLNRQASRNIHVLRLQRRIHRVVLSSTAVYTLCTLVALCTVAHAFLDGLFICVHFTSGILLACFPIWLLCATAVPRAAGSQLSMLLVEL